MSINASIEACPGLDLVFSDREATFMINKTEQGPKQPQLTGQAAAILLEAGTSVQPQDTAQEQIIALWPSYTSTNPIQVPRSPVYVMMVTNPYTPDPQAEEPMFLSQPNSSVPN
eukprot:gene4805-34559_t